MMPEASVLMVSGDLEQVENELSAGVLGCPGCSGRLARWGRARIRNERAGGGEVVAVHVSGADRVP